MNYQPRPFDYVLSKLTNSGVYVYSLYDRRTGVPPQPPSDHLKTFLIRTDALGYNGLFKAALFTEECHLCIYKGYLALPPQLPFELVVDVMEEYTTEEEILTKWQRATTEEQAQIIRFVNGNRHLPNLRFFLCECDSFFISGNVETSMKFTTVGGLFDRPGLPDYQLAHLLGFQLVERPENVDMTTKIPPPRKLPPKQAKAPSPPSGATVQKQLPLSPQRITPEQLAERRARMPKRIRVGKLIYKTKG